MTAINVREYLDKLDFIMENAVNEIIYETITEASENSEEAKAASEKRKAAFTSILVKGFQKAITVLITLIRKISDKISSSSPNRVMTADTVILGGQTYDYELMSNVMKAIYPDNKDQAASKYVIDYLHKLEDKNSDFRIGTLKKGDKINLSRINATIKRYEKDLVRIEKIVSGKTNEDLKNNASNSANRMHAAVAKESSVDDANVEDKTVPSVVTRILKSILFSYQQIEKNSAPIEGDKTSKENADEKKNIVNEK